jgi:hypothetical protein
MTAYCKLNDINQQFIVPHSQHQNGVSERVNLTLFNPVRCIMYQTDEPQVPKLPTLWDEALLNDVYTSNLSPTAANGAKTPY